MEAVEKRTACFSTAPTSLGKLGQKHAEFPTVPTAPTTNRVYISGEERGTNREEKRIRLRLDQSFKPDMSRAIKSGHFNLLRTSSNQKLPIVCEGI
jgi:hypothetical protein